MTGPDALAQLVGVGVVWMSVHCVGMCGPLLTGLDVAGDRTARGMGRTLLYQSGRAVSYAALGAAAGNIGAGLTQAFSGAGAALAVLLGVIAVARAAGVTFATGARPVRIGRASSASSSSAPTTWLVQFMGVIHPSHPLRPFVLGMVLALMPCMIALWALGLAAMTASPLWGAVVMVTLVAMTTPLLLAVGVLSSWLRRIAPHTRAHVQRAMLAIAGLWMVCIGLAGAGIVDHQHIPVTLGNAHYVIMLF